MNKKIISEKTLGERLKATRRRKHISLSQVEEATKVRSRYLEALENGSYVDLPADVYVLGFLAKYADFLGFSKNEAIVAYRRERGFEKRPKILVPQAKFKEKKAYLTPKVVVGSIVILVILAILGYIFYAVKNFTSPPNLEISSPSTDTIIYQDKVEVIGKTDEGVSLQINGQTVFLDENGNFTETIKLQSGLNNIELRAVNRVKKENIKVIKILAEY